MPGTQGAYRQKRRRAEIRVFKSDPQCRIFLSTDSGGVGLNLQNASVVINCDLPWNPAKLEQRIARAWRKNQVRAVTVINLISENTIEHRILGTLAAKQSLADGVLDAIGNLNEVKLQRKGQTFFERLELMLGSPIHLKAPPPPPFAPPADPAEAFARHAAQLLGSELVACEERFPEGQTHSVLVVVVERDPAAWRERLREGYLKSVGNGQPNSPDDMQLEVVDRFVEEAIQRLCETGILQKRIRATRHLYPENGVASRLLNDDERNRIAGLRDRLKRKLKMANLLASEELLDEARDALKDAVLFAGRLIAAEARLPEPENLEAVLLSPLVLRWGNNRSLVNGFLTNPAFDLQPVLHGLQSLV